jgi:hypothetical protein
MPMYLLSLSDLLSGTSPISTLYWWFAAISPSWDEPHTATVLWRMILQHNAHRLGLRRLRNVRGALWRLRLLWVLRWSFVICRFFRNALRVCYNMKRVARRYARPSLEQSHEHTLNATSKPTDDICRCRSCIGSFPDKAIAPARVVAVRCSNLQYCSHEHWQLIVNPSW